MNKKLLISMVLTLITIIFTGCSQQVICSEMYEGVPIYPESILSDSSEYREYYKMSEFNGTFTEVNEFFLKNINYDIWTVKENPLQVNGEYSFIGSLSSQGYILKTEFVYHQIMEDQNPIQSRSEKRTRGGRECSLIEFDGSYNREYELKIQKEAINNAYIEIIWEEDCENKIEKIDLGVVQ